MASRSRAVLKRIFSAAAGLVFGLIGAELTFGQLRPELPRPDAVLYSIEVRDGQGELLASPLVVGEEGRPVHLSLNSEGPHSEPLAMSLDLSPQQDGAGGYCLGYKLSIDDGFAHSGRLSGAYGRANTVQLKGNGESLNFSLTVAKAHTREFGRILQLRRGPAA